MDERSSVITIGGVEYELLLTTKATKEIAKRYGGLEKLGIPPPPIPAPVPYI